MSSTVTSTLEGEKGEDGVVELRGSEVSERVREWTGGIRERGV
jgi:hypothetical protein